MDISEVKNTIYHLTHECYGESEVADAICELRKFCDYLDTGLTPEEIIEHEEMFKAYRNVCGGKSPEEISALIAERDTLKKALELACGKLAISQWSKVTAQEMYDYYIQQAQKQEG